MKRLLTSMVTICLVLLFTIGSVHAVLPSQSIQTNRASLSELTESECAEFLENYNISVPDELDGIINLSQLFAQIEESPFESCSINHPAYFDFYEEVRSAIISYFGVSASAKAGASRYTLQYSTLYSWNTSMKNYNCYAYSINRPYSRYAPGSFSGQSYNHAANVDSLAALVEDDLKGDMGYHCVKVQTSRPSSVGSWENAIAVKKDTTYDANGFNDYHFAKLTSSGWLHKPSITAILKFISAPNSTTSWTNERYDGTTYIAPDVTYDSAVRYILYKPNHGNTTYTWTGEHYHSGSQHFYLYAYVCNDCGEYTSTVWTSSSCSGPPCSTPWVITPVLMDD